MRRMIIGSLIYDEEDDSHWVLLVVRIIIGCQKWVCMNLVKIRFWAEFFHFTFPIKNGKKCFDFVGGQSRRKLTKKLQALLWLPPHVVFIRLGAIYKQNTSRKSWKELFWGAKYALYLRLTNPQVLVNCIQIWH